ncbi:hypothetical protein B0E44_06885 [Flavobacterium sp. A45]|nr:hypothetical protein B0E44_06885 [Flavobacterium sp. A45]
MDTLNFTEFLKSLELDCEKTLVEGINSTNTKTKTILNGVVKFFMINFLNYIKLGKHINKFNIFFQNKETKINTFYDKRTYK